ncbi:hypothetical protein HYC85_021936 [Camellia sinensis]|uniref:WRKY domain-containing protein n=1 Tax=Camellia sinensis TaxID=4442 RepID=A0A7J7GIX7_CAMSI|nr:hypothetical protein HYC85_021936 [Camellia sinensis]
MEVKEAGRIVIAKPVPSKPTCSNFGSFSDLLAGAINSSPTNARPETAVTAIRPKTVRFKPATTPAPVGVVSSQAEISGVAMCCPSDKVDKVLNSDSKSTVLYKPLAKVVSKTTFSMLANLGNSNISHQQALAQVEARVQTPNPFKSNFRSDLSLTFQPNFSSQAEREKTTEPSNIALENTEGGQKSLPPTSSVDRPSYDGYNWRKYGQKQVKGSEYPRSYYKCTHPNCQVKKKVERSLDGQIAEIVYKGEHNHSKPQPLKRNASGGQGQGFVSDGIVQETNNAPSWSNKLNERIEGSEGRIENQNEVGLSTHSTYSGKAPPCYDHVGGRAVNTGLGTPEHSCGLSGDCEDGSKGLEAEDDEPKSKRRKNENEPGMSGEGVQDPPAVVQNSPDPEIIGDGFRWRKYGQKVVKGNPYPSQDISYLEETEVEKHLAFPSLEMGSLESEGLVEIASILVGLLQYWLHEFYYLNLLKIVGDNYK